MTILGFLMIVIIWSEAAYANGTGDVEFEKIRAQYPTELAVFLKYDEALDISIVDDSLVLHSNIDEEMLHLNDQSSMFAKNQIYTSHFLKVSNISASTLIPDKKRFREYAVSDFKESYDKNSSSFYDDTKYLNFVFPAVQPGAKTVLKYTEQITDPRFISTYFFSSYVPIISAKYVVTSDEGVNLKFYYFNKADQLVAHTEVHKNGRVIHTFTYKNCPKFTYEKNSPDIRYVAPHIICVVQNYKTSAGQLKNVLASTDDLYAWYTQFIQGLKNHDDPNLHEIVHNLIQQNDPDTVKVRKIFYWVQSNIKYIAFEEGMRGLIPHDGGYVCNKRYGDCKDMASILVNMLHMAGVEAYFTWVGTRDLPYRYTEIPSPAVDNHMIATYFNGTKNIFLDATAQYEPYGLPSSMIQGKEVLIAKDDKLYQIDTVPVVPKEDNIMSDSSAFWLDGNVVDGQGKMALTGYAKVFNAYKLGTTDQLSIDKYVTKLLGRGSNKFFVDQYDVNNVNEFDQPITIDYQYHTEDYFRKIGDDIYINLNLDKSFDNYLIDVDKRQYPLENKYKYINRNVAEFKLPPNYSIGYLPKDEQFENDVFGFSIHYKAAGNKILINKDFYVKYLIMPLDKVAQWNEAIKNLSAAYREVLVLKKNTAADK